LPSWSVVASRRSPPNAIVTVARSPPTAAHGGHTPVTITPARAPARSTPVPARNVRVMRGRDTASGSLDLESPRVRYRDLAVRTGELSLAQGILRIQTDHRHLRAFDRRPRSSRTTTRIPCAARAARSRPGSASLPHGDTVAHHHPRQVPGRATLTTISLGRLAKAKLPSWAVMVARSSHRPGEDVHARSRYRVMPSSTPAFERAAGSQHHAHRSLAARSHADRLTRALTYAGWRTRARTRPGSPAGLRICRLAR